MKKVFGAILPFFLLVIMQMKCSGLPYSYGVNYFNQSIGARSLGLGATMVTAGEDGTFSFSNPAGLNGISGTFFSIDSQNMALMQAFKLGQGSLGFGLISHSAQDTKNGYSYNNTSSSIVYAQKIGVFSMGGNFKYILREEYKKKTDPVKTGNGWDIDIGATAQLNRWLKAGAYMQNVVPALAGGRNIWSNGTSEGITMMARAGIGLRLFGKNSLFEKNNFRKTTLFMDIEINPLFILTGHFGYEMELNDLWALRAGLDQQMRNNKIDTTATFGIGTQMDKWNIDMGYDPLSAGSAAVTLYYVPDEAKRAVKSIEFPTLNVISPPDNYVTDEPVVTVKGNAKQLKIKINGLDVFVKADGAFFAEIPLYTGKNMIEVTGIGEANRKVLIQRRVLRTSKIVVEKEVRLEERKAEIVKTEEKILQKELEVASLEARPVQTEREKKEIAKEKVRIEKEKTAVSAEKTRVEKEVTVVKEKRTKVEALATLGVIEAKEDVPYDIEEKITRAELAMWLVKARGIPVYSVQKDLYPDVKENYWAAAFIQAVVSKGLMSPYPDGRFHPDDGIKESEGYNILKKFDRIK